MKRKHVIAASAALIVALAVSRPASAAVLYESATMGPTVTNFMDNFSLNNQHLGVRFTLDNPAHIKEIGGHVLGTGTGAGFARIAIVPLQPDGFPVPSVNGAHPDLQSTALALGVLNLPLEESAEIRAAVDVMLPAGTYGLVIGGDLFGPSTGGPGVMIANNVDIGTPEYFFWEWHQKTWANSGFLETRFVVVGVYVPEPSAAAIALAGLSCVRVRRRHQPVSV